MTMQKLARYLAVIIVGVTAMPAFASAAFEYTYERTPAGDTVTNAIYGSITVSDDSDCSFIEGGATKAGLIVTRFGGGSTAGNYVPYTVGVPFVASVDGLPLSSELDDPDGQYTGITLRLANDAEDSTCNKTLESSSYPARLFTLVEGTTTPPGGGGGDDQPSLWQDSNTLEIWETVAVGTFITLSGGIAAILAFAIAMLSIGFGLRMVKKKVLGNRF